MIIIIVFDNPLNTIIKIIYLQLYGIKYSYLL